MINLVSKKNLVIGIDASRNRSGGAKEHLLGILSHLDPARYGIGAIHLWSHQTLLEVIPNHPWLIKHPVAALNQSLVAQLWWQATDLAKALRAEGCDLLFTSDASSLCRFNPAVVLSQDLLAYEPGVMHLFGISKARLRLELIKMVQNENFRRARGVIFLTHYAAKLIQASCGKLANIKIVNHGVAGDFQEAQVMRTWPENSERPIECLYISNAALYKYQWVVIKAIGLLRKRGYDLRLRLIGGGSGLAQKKIDQQLAIDDPHHQWTQQLGFVPHDQLLPHLISADCFIFASGCEAFGITLLEAMAVGLPIAASSRSSIAETLADGGVYFDPANAQSIASALEKIILEAPLRERLTGRAKVLASNYSWQACADETWQFIIDTYHHSSNQNPQA